MKNRNQILDFFKTDHFLQRQWENGIEDMQLRRVIPHLSNKENNKTVVIVMPSFFQQDKDNNPKREKNCLILITYQNILKTTYYCDHPNYLFKKEKDGGFQVLY